MENKIDLQIIESLRALSEPGEEDVVVTLSRLYLDDFAEAITEIKLSLDKGALPICSAVAHKMKSSSGNLGLKELQRGFLELERGSKTPPGVFDIDDLKALLHLIEIEFLDVEPILRTFAQGGPYGHHSRTG